MKTIECLRVNTRQFFGMGKTGLIIIQVTVCEASGVNAGFLHNFQ